MVYVYARYMEVFRVNEYKLVTTKDNRRAVDTMPASTQEPTAGQQTQEEDGQHTQALYMNQEGANKGTTTAPSPTTLENDDGHDDDPPTDGADTQKKKLTARQQKRRLRQNRSRWAKEKTSGQEHEQHENSDHSGGGTQTHHP